VNKTQKFFGAIAAAAAAVALPFVSFATTIEPGDVTVPTSTTHDLLASVSNVFTDTGMLSIVVIAAALPLVFWLAHQVIGLLPKSRAKK